MARVLVADPVRETRELVQRLLRHAGHEVVLPGATAAVEAIDVLVYDPAWRHGRGLAASLGRRVGLVDCAATPEDADPDADVHVLQPFTPRELLAAIEAAVVRVAGPRDAA